MAGTRDVERAFRSTRWSLVLAAARPEGADFRDALGELVVAYEPAIRAFFRAWRPGAGSAAQEAEERTQAFLVRWAERGVGPADPGRGSFRGYLRGALRHFAENLERDGTRLKRGGDRAHVPLAAAHGVASPAPTPEQAFDAAWRRRLLALALERLEEEPGVQAEERLGALLFRRANVDPPAGRPPSHAELAAATGCDPRRVGTLLARARERFRVHVSALVRESVADGESFRREMEALLDDGA